MRCIGVDVGGANIKLADGRGWSQHEPFALWQHPGELSERLRFLFSRSPAFDQIALTMTGELTDCFATKQEGVEFIIDATSMATELPVSVYLTGNRFADPSLARQEFMLAAASNWFCLATWLATLPEMADRRGLLLDIGSTTTDIIPFAGGRCMARGKTDFDRLVNRELVYTGVVRSPLSGIVRHVTIRGTQCPVMNELFATTLDTNIVLGNLPPGSCPQYAADHGNTLIEGCVARLARMVGLDHSLIALAEAESLARQIFDCQVGQLVDAGRAVIQLHGVPEVVVVAGQGEFLAQEVCRYINTDSCAIPNPVCFSQWFGADNSSCATAHAAAALLTSRLNSGANPHLTIPMDERR